MTCKRILNLIIKTKTTTKKTVHRCKKYIHIHIIHILIFCMYMGYSYLYMCICTGIKNFNIFNFMHIYERPIHTKNDTVTVHLSCSCAYVRRSRRIYIQSSVPLLDFSISHFKKEMVCVRRNIYCFFLHHAINHEHYSGLRYMMHS